MKTDKAVKQLKLLKNYGKDDLELPSEIFNRPWKSLISTILSARTRDEVTIKVSVALYNKYPSVKKLAKSNLKSIMKIIKPVNFYKTKSKNVLNCARVLNNKYNGKPPQDFRKLTELPGVGRKTANVFLQEQGYDTIGIDTHVFQLARLLGWTKNTKPEKIENDLKTLFPRKYWKEINPVLVRFGRTYRGKSKNKIIKELRKL
jgi:endonuclease III